MIHIGYKYKGVADGTVYEVISIDPRGGTTYGMGHKKDGKYSITNVSHSLLMWLIKSGGLVRI